MYLYLYPASNGHDNPDPKQAFVLFSGMVIGKP